MALSSDLISQFVKVTNDTDTAKTETIVYGTIKVSDGKTYVQIDGSTIYTPISSTTTAKDGDRVTVMIKDHSAVVTGNMSAPSARQESVDEVEKDLHNKIAEVGILVADKVSTEQLNAIKANINELTAKDVEITNQLNAFSIKAGELIADNATIKGQIQAASGKFDEIDATFVTINGYVQAANGRFDTLEATDAEFRNLESDYAAFKQATVDSLEAGDAIIKSLDSKYATIDFSNIQMAAIEELFTKSGIIKDLVVGDQSITGELVGVTIKGELIEAGTVQADRLVIKGEDGIYYKLNIEAGATTSEEVSEEDLQNGLHGDTIVAHTITAEKINVKDLVAFGATIGGFHISDTAIYSGVKESVDSPIEGSYLGSDGQVSMGDSDNFLKLFVDSDGRYKLVVSADEITLGSEKKSVTSAIGELEELRDSVEQTHVWLKVRDEDVQIGRDSSPFSVNIDDNEMAIKVKGAPVLWFEGTEVNTEEGTEKEYSGEANIPELKITKKFNFFGFDVTEEITTDDNGEEICRINCEYVGG